MQTLNSMLKKCYKHNLKVRPNSQRNKCYERKQSKPEEVRDAASRGNSGRSQQSLWATLKTRVLRGFKASEKPRFLAEASPQQVESLAAAVRKLISN